VERAVSQSGSAREVDRAGELRDERQRRVEPRGRVVTNRDVERFSRDVFLREIGRASLDACRNRRDDRRMPEAGIDEALELIGERARLFRCQIESKGFDCRESIA
jgi:hypothetical protein